MRASPGRSLAASAAVLLAGGPAAVAADPPPATSGDAVLVVDARTGDAMHAANAGSPRPIASATKLMTALLTLERAQLDDVFPAAQYAASPVESKINLMPGERMTVRDLSTALLLESANDAAVTLAEGVAGSREAFVREMNRRAVELGLSDTSYANPIGFDDPDNHSSARDLARLARRLLANREFARIVDLPMATLESGARPRTIDNRNAARAALPVRHRREDRAHARRRVRARRGGHRRRRPGDHGDARGAERVRPRRGHARAAAVGARAVPSRARGASRASRSPSWT